MSQGSGRPGPARTSCLTCRRRHKKCDLRQPTCERCEKGDFKCLGYGDARDGQLVAARSARRLLPKAIEHNSLSIQSPSPSFHHNGLSDNSLSPRRLPKNTILASLSSHSSTSSDLNAPDEVRTPPLTVLESRNVDSQLLLRQTIVAAGTSMPTLRRMFDLYTRLPDPTRDLFKPLDGRWFIDTIVGQLEKFANYWYFKVPGFQKQFRPVIVQRLSNSKFARWVSLVSVSVLESFITGDTSKTQLHKTWIDFIEGSLRHELALDLTPHQIRNRWSALVHVSLMKTRFMPSSNGYQLLRSIAPAFLQVVYSDPTIWSGHCDFTRVPLSNVLVSNFHELALFTVIDCTYAVAYGFPQQVEYDTTECPQHSGSASHQWIHSSPLEFHLALADINACRDMSPAAKNPKDIEEWLILWESKPGEYAFAESWMAVAWYAVQESWRLALLVYLYLAVYNAPSDDPRIQLRVRQILQVVGTLKKRGPSHLNVSLFFQYLMVGICACNEAHRQKVWDKLASADETKFWFIPVSEFVPVLDHLWHGAGADGRPVTWSDYIHSREAVLPIPL